ncbi:hypothetical protein ABE493_12835 [Stenotrophomonas terrae]|uniref:hypothetical protein n=1 Tax=Stenotrophomonas terrae TaxID=405446 RepID=UPI003209E689
MNKLLLLILVAFATLATGCDREKYAEHRSERSKPKTEVTLERIAIRRAPYPNLDILPDGRLRVDDIVIPLNAKQQELLHTSYVKLQILRQNTLVDADPALAQERSLPLQIPEGQSPFPPDLAQQIPEFKEYDEALANLRALR